MLIVNKGIAQPWECDVMGHMTTRFYVAMFDDASYHFLFTVFGWTISGHESRKFGWADARHVIEYKSEVSAGDVLEIRARGCKKSAPNHSPYFMKCSTWRVMKWLPRRNPFAYILISRRARPFRLLKRCGREHSSIWNHDKGQCPGLQNEPITKRSIPFMPVKFENASITDQVVLITAGAAGIGRVIAEKFLSHGCSVHICDIDRAAH